MTEKTALKRVETVYGSLEDFAYYILDTEPAIMQSDLGISRRAELARLPLDAMQAIARSPAFRKLLGSMMSRTAFGIIEEQQHLEKVVKIAKGEGKTVMDQKTGRAVQVDNDEKAIMAAGEYLNRYSGTPLDTPKDTSGTRLNIVLVGSLTPGSLDPGAGAGGGGSEVIDVDSVPTVQGVPLEPHQPLLPGQLPPRAALDRQLQAEGAMGKERHSRVAGTDLDFTSSDRSEAARSAFSQNRPHPSAAHEHGRGQDASTKPPVPREAGN